MWLTVDAPTWRFGLAGFPASACLVCRAGDNAGMDPDTVKPPPRQRFQFSLATLLRATAAWAVVFAVAVISNDYYVLPFVVVPASCSFFGHTDKLGLAWQVELLSGPLAGFFW